MKPDLCGVHVPKFLQKAVWTRKSFEQLGYGPNSRFQHEKRAPEPFNGFAETRAGKGSFNFCLPKLNFLIFEPNSKPVSGPQRDFTKVARSPETR